MVKQFIIISPGDWNKVCFLAGQLIGVVIRGRVTTQVKNVYTELSEVVRKGKSIVLPYPENPFSSHTAFINLAIEKGPIITMEQACILFDKVNVKQSLAIVSRITEPGTRKQIFITHRLIKKSDDFRGIAYNYITWLVSPSKALRDIAAPGLIP